MNVSQCNIDSIRITVQSDKQSYEVQYMVENPEILIHNSSFSSLDLNPGTKAQITDCYVDAQFKPRPTLVTANNSDVVIQNCHFGHFINENGSTVLYGQDNSHITIENSVFIQHNSSKGVLLLQNNSFMYVNILTISRSMATSLGYSSISLQHMIQMIMHNTVFRNNSALSGGAMFVEDQCRVALTNCTFSSNIANAGKTLNISKISNLRRASSTLVQNSTRAFTPPTHILFNQTSIGDKNPKVIVFHGLGGAILAKLNVTLDVQETTFIGNKASDDGGAINIQNHAYLRMTNCVFDENISGRLGGAISAAFNATLHVQETTFVSNKAFQYAGGITAGQNATLYTEETTFVGNKAQYAGAIFAHVQANLFLDETTFVGNKASGEGGAINIQQQAYLRMTNCVFDENISERLGGAIAAAANTTLEIQETNFTHNRATMQGGAIDIDIPKTYLGVTDCMFENNHVEHLNYLGLGGAIFGGYGIILEIQGTSFTRNSAWQSGAINIDTLGYLSVTDCTFEDNRATYIAGAIYSGYQAVLEINGSYFSNNSAPEGGAINVQTESNLSLSYCEFKYNFASVDGGAVTVMSNVKLKVEKNNFTDNSAYRLGGALLMDTGTECHMEWCVFLRNAAKVAGGAVFVVSNSSLRTEYTNFMNNNANNGGAISIQGNSKLQTKMCSFWENFAKQAGGAITLKGYSSAVIETCHFLSNHAVSGGALEINNSEHVSVHSTSFLRNVASAAGGAISISDGTDVIIDNITCINNQSPGNGGCLVVYSAILTLTNSDISENIGRGLGAGVTITDSKIQVGAEHSYEISALLLNINV